MEENELVDPLSVLRKYGRHRVGLCGRERVDSG